MHILFATPVVAPYSKTGGLADVSRSLPAEMRMAGAEVTIVTPLYASLDMVGYRLAERLVDVEVPIDGEPVSFRVLEGRTPENVRIFFLQNDALFGPGSLPSAGGELTDEDGVRFGAFSRAACELVKVAAIPVDIAHCNDWQTALVPVFLEECYADWPKLADVIVALTIHNLAHQGQFSPAVLRRLGLPTYLYHPEHLEFYGKVNFLKGGILFADVMTTVSGHYAEEIRTPEFGCGFEGLLQRRAEDLYGIRNGVDYSVWDPTTDPLLPVRYDREHLTGKRRCKAALQMELGLPVVPGTPLLAFVGRFVEQKGLDLISDILDDLMDRGVQLVILGQGEPHYETAARLWADEFPRQIATRVAYDEALAHRIIAGADALLVPSRYEPGGRSHLFAMRYGTIPIARLTGGLADTITPPGVNRPGNGFLFENFEADAIFDAVNRALDVFERPRDWREMQLAAMREDFSWRRTAQAYLDLFSSLL